MKLYNLFPLLAGQFKHWDQHIERAAAMGFDWIFVNPVQKPGVSGSLYSIADYFQLNPRLINKRSLKTPNAQLKSVIRRAEQKHGVRMMTDLVINHCAIDSDLIVQRPQWFVHDDNGNLQHPYCLEDDGERTVWYDLARFDHEQTTDPEGLYNYFLSIVEHYIGLGFRGFRCDAAYQLPDHLWRRLIRDIKIEYPDIVFVAETLGCTEQQSKQTAQAGFDYIFNSSKWWDFSSPWLIDQYRQFRETVVPSISFPESHDTQRLYHESDHNIEVIKQRYLFAAIFSAAVMMPMGYEFGFKKALHVVDTSPEDWESTDIDLTRYITQVNGFKSAYKVFQEDGPINVISDLDTPVLFFWKASNCKQQEALIILNKDPWNKQHFSTDNLYQFIQSGKPLKDLSLEYPLDYLPTPYEFGLNPGMARVMVAA
ncbi:MAG TPA: alpha-amylase [Crenotrichaceae bacterium]|nr:alpha-amylase [Crenotrichaceae bacterium]